MVRRGRPRLLRVPILDVVAEGCSVWPQVGSESPAAAEFTRVARGVRQKTSRQCLGMSRSLNRIRDVNASVNKRTASERRRTCCRLNEDEKA